MDCLVGRVGAITLEQVEPLLLSLKDYWCRSSNMREMTTLLKQPRVASTVAEYEL